MKPFKCTKCKKPQDYEYVEEVMVGVTIYSDILGAHVEDSDFIDYEYGEKPRLSGGDVIRYQCRRCGSDVEFDIETDTFKAKE